MKKQFHIGRLGNSGLRIAVTDFKFDTKILDFEPNGSSLLLHISSLNSWSISQASSGSINWDDSSDSIFFSQISGEGDATITINSDENSGYRRSKKIEFNIEDKSGNVKSKILEIKQYGIYDGEFATTPASEYVEGLDGGYSINT